MSGLLEVATLRPGMATGDYPERAPESLARDVLEPDFLSAKRRPHNLARKALFRFVQDVHQHALPLTNEAPSSMGGHIDELRSSLATHGITDALAARCFALVREISARELGLRHYDTQLAAGRAMLCGGVAQMQTGEGKTLAAILPACTAALAGIPVHVITANDYLAARDAAAMGPVYRALGLSVGAVTAATPQDRRRAAYGRDVVYTTSKQLAFDYLRDRLALGEGRGNARLKMEKLYDGAARLDRTSLRGLCFAIVDEADSVLIDEASTPFVIARDVDASHMRLQCQAALDAAAGLKQPRDFRVDRARRRVVLSETGRETARHATDIPGATPRQREAMLEQALAAMHLYRCGHDYLIKDGKVQIIDRHTGRILADRSWERGLHQMIEVLENCDVSAPRETLASLTFQRLFPRYRHLAGTTGTATDVASELLTTYRLPVVEIPTHRRCQRRGYPLHVARSREDKIEAIVAAARREHARRRPVLIGTRSVAASELLSARLEAAGLMHEVLNARQDAREAGIVERAGLAGQITVATNMAGRGTDIKLGPGVEELGGLHVILAEPNEARRIDRQLIGRCARQGQPGTYQVFACARDELIEQHAPAVAARLLRPTNFGERLPRLMSSVVIRMTQRRCELHQRAVSRNLRTMQESYDQLLGFTGTQTR